jgi:hypothetical protein
VDEPIELAWPAKRSWAEVALTKAVDTVEDVAVIARRTFAKDLPGWVFLGRGEQAVERQAAVLPRLRKHCWQLWHHAPGYNVLAVPLCMRHVLCAKVAASAVQDV